ncbi:hypothetical protein [Sporosarcina sp. A2]|uniref:hypothetical protein n=1 Tax=Sporosarcina sp. A2 TaxID=3393449 RepID=UPI003D7AA1E0
MFGISDFISLVISVFIILPIVVFIRELGYLPVTFLLGVKNPRLTIGSGPRVYQFGVFDIRKYYHTYSWFSFDRIKRTSNFSYILLYSSPILTNLIVTLSLNTLIANGYLEDQVRFWNRFMFYSVFYLLFDVIPMIMTNGKPNNGMIIYELLRYGKRVDYNKDDLIPSTSQVDKEYEIEMKEIETIQKKVKEDTDSSPSDEQIESEVVKNNLQDDVTETVKEIEKEEVKKEQK